MSRPDFIPSVEGVYIPLHISLSARQRHRDTDSPTPRTPTTAALWTGMNGMNGILQDHRQTDRCILELLDRECSRCHSS